MPDGQAETRRSGNAASRLRHAALSPHGRCSTWYWLGLQRERCGAPGRLFRAQEPTVDERNCLGICGLRASVRECRSGHSVRPRLPEQHRARETQELMQITIGRLVTFAARTACRRSPAGGRCRDFA